MTVIFSIHQPRYNIFKLFDTLMLLASGHVIFHGKASKALDFFQEQDFKCDAHNNPSDFFLDIINGDVSYHSSVSSSVTSSTISQMHWDPNADCNRDIRAFGYSLEDLKKGSIVPALTNKFRESHFYHNWNEKMKETMRNLKVKSDSEGKQHIRAHSTSFLSQLYYVSKRTMVNVVRNPAGLIAQLALMIIFGFIIGTLYFDLTDSKDSLQDRAGCFYVTILVQMFGNLGAIELFIKERSLFLHECRSGYYRVSAYFFSKMFCDLIPQRIIPLIFFCSITYFMTGLVRSADKFFIYFLTIFLTTLCSAVMTILVSACNKVFAMANVITGLMIMIMMLFGGLLLNVKSIPEWIRWLQHLSIVRYSYKALLINEIKDVTFHNQSCDGIQSYNSSVTGNFFLQKQDIAYEDPWHLWQNMAALGVGTVILAVFCYVRLRLMV